MKRHLRRAAWILVFLVLLGVIGWTAANLIGSWRYQSAVASLEADGFVLDPSRIGPPAVAVADNAAPYYSAAFALYVRPPDPAPWEEHPMKRLAEAKPGDRAAAEAWLKQNSDAFDMVRRGQKRPRCRFPRDYSEGYSMPMPELTGIVSLSRALALLAESQLLAGDVVGARESTQLIFALGDCLSDEPVLVSQLVRLVAVESGLAVVETAVTEATGEADLREWQALLPAATFFQGGLERGYRGEIVMATGLLRKPVAETLALLEGVQGGRATIAWDLMRPLVRYDGAGYLHDMRRMVLASRKPYLEGKEDVPDRYLHGLRSIWNPVRACLLPALSSALRRQATVEARLAVLRAGIEAERVHKATGAYPKAVAGTDPFSGKPLVYDLEKGRIASVRPVETDQDRPTEWRLRAKK
jgi:hypothetical protein